MSSFICNTILDINNRELNTKGTLEFPVSIFNDCLEVQPVPYHWHEELEFIIVESGKIKISVEFESFILNSGNGIFINSGRFHSCESYENTNPTIKSIVFHPRIIYGDINSIYYKKYLSNLLKENNLNFYKFKNDVQIEKEMIQEILYGYNLHETLSDGYEFCIRECLTKVIMSIINSIDMGLNQVSNKRLRDLKRYRKMIHYIENHFNQHIALCDIAKSSTISESESLRCFNHILGISPIQYVKKCRLQKAQSMLLTTTQSIIDIGFGCGFSEMSYFSKSFKNRYGSTPSSYRKENTIDTNTPKNSV